MANDIGSTPHNHRKYGVSGGGRGHGNHGNTSGRKRIHECPDVSQVLLEIGQLFCGFGKIRLPNSTLNTLRGQSKLRRYGRFLTETSLLCPAQCTLECIQCTTGAQKRSRCNARCCAHRRFTYYREITYLCHGCFSQEILYRLKSANPCVALCANECTR